MASCVLPLRHLLLRLVHELNELLSFALERKPIRALIPNNVLVIFAAERQQLSLIGYFSRVHHRRLCDHLALNQKIAVDAMSSILYHCLVPTKL